MQYLQFLSRGLNIYTFLVYAKAVATHILPFDITIKLKTPKVRLRKLDIIVVLPGEHKLFGKICS